MLPNSLEYLLLFLPTVVGAVALWGRFFARSGVIVPLVFFSLLYPLFFGFGHLLILGISLVGNFFLVRFLERYRNAPFLTSTLLLNVGLLALSRYGGMSGREELMGSGQYQFAFPLGISFVTFQQIALLVDTYRGGAMGISFLEYAICVLFFPRIGAGPICRFHELLPQLPTLRVTGESMAVGSTMLLIGLLKKILADTLGGFADPVFFLAEEGDIPVAYIAWGGALAFSLQVYMDFSGYSDMALGACRLFGLRLPQNFDAPYRATSIIDFWRRWHITLYRFLRDYIYIPLGGNRCGKVRLCANIMIVTLLAGLWHGAGWTFVLWGALHGMLLIINNAWRRRSNGRFIRLPLCICRPIAVLSTFLVVTLTWVLFRADSLLGALRIYYGMTRSTSAQIFHSLQWQLRLLKHLGLSDFGGKTTMRVTVTREVGGWETAPFWITVSLLLIFFAPTTQQLLRAFRPTIDRNVANISPHFPRWLCWRPTILWGAFCGVLTVLGLHLIAFSSTSFLYFRF